jgi:hypothetical protein
MKRFFYIIILAVLFSSCCTEKRCNRKFPVKVETRYDTVINYVRHDSLWIMPEDSALLEMFMDCDKDNRAYIKEIKTLKGQNPKIHVQIKEKILRIKATCDSAKIIASWLEKNKTITNGQTVTKEIKTNIITGWQWFQIYCGRVLWIIAVVVILRLLINKYFAK